MQRNIFTANNENLGVAAAAGNGTYSDQGLSNALISLNRFRSNANAGVLIAGPADSVTASSNNSGADGAFFAVFAAGTNYRVTNNVVNGSAGSGIFFGVEGVGIIEGVLIQQNTINQSLYSGVRIREAVHGALVVGNTSNGNGDQGISVSSELDGATTVRSNTTNRNNGDGILFSELTTGNTVASNRAFGNGNLDCEDQSTGAGTAGTANTWTANIGAKRDPMGICAPRRR